ncbi:hypothetical protein CH292_14415 [Rhodococcus sp. 14-2470-1a]|nr:hypothetical protein CH267_05820 [Rhodococcus sp. 06-621-2]OZF49737.1 hypothetical protein CH292_14415 [Rhodococcus sp. 14-2470-1a]
MVPPRWAAAGQQPGVPVQADAADSAAATSVPPRAAGSPADADPDAEVTMPEPAESSAAESSAAGQ